MTKILALAALAALVFVAGCVSQQQQPRVNPNDELALLLDRAVEAQKAPALDPIRDKVYLGRAVQETPLGLLALSSRPTEEEKKAIEAWDGVRRGEAFRELEAWRGKYMPWNRPVSQMTQAAMTTLMAQLYAGELTYGEFNRKRMNLAAEAAATASKRTQEVMAIARQSKYQEDAAMYQDVSLGLQAYSTMLQTQNLINQQNQPVRIAPFTCRQSGPAVNCF